MWASVAPPRAFTATFSCLESSWTQTLSGRAETTPHLSHAGPLPPLPPLSKAPFRFPELRSCSHLRAFAGLFPLPGTAFLSFISQQTVTGLPTLPGSLSQPAPIPCPAHIWTVLLAYLFATCLLAPGGSTLESKDMDHLTAAAPHLVKQRCSREECVGHMVTSLP